LGGYPPLSLYCAFMEWKAFILSLLQWIESQGPEAALWILLLEALFILILIPGPFFTMAAGFLLGIRAGFAVSICGCLLGSTLAYGIGRYVFPARKTSGQSRRRWIVILEHFIRGGDWKIIASTRLVPVFPFKLSNYVFGWLKFPFRPFIVGTLLGIMPMTALSVTAGSVAADMTALLRPGAEGMENRWPWSVGGLAAALALAVYAGYQGRKKFRETEAASAMESGTHPNEPALAKDPNRERDLVEGSE
jgi:uncharacterized membrane protein YdjX (TVP38/TMEM64 family)